MSVLLTGCYTGLEDASLQFGGVPADTDGALDGGSSGGSMDPGPLEPGGSSGGGAETSGGDTGGDWPGLGESGGGETTGDQPDPGFCGDGVLDPEEACDLGGDNGEGSTCTSDCETNVCGDGILGPGETCDDGNLEGSDGCGPTCALESCGDGVKNLGEACDDGQNGDPDDGCTDACALPTCGDGLVQPSQGEQCDDGNGSNTDGCTNACQNATCGDGFNGPGEQCDDGNGSNTDGCTNACQNATCGDGFNGPGEECDDGDNNDDDNCSNTCESQHGGGIPISGYCSPVRNSQWANSWEDREAQMLTLVNQARSVGRNCGGNFYPAVPPLSYDGSLTCSARNHSRDMAQNNFFSHTGTGGTSPAQRISMAEYDGSGTSENILAGTVINTAQEALDAWLDSPGHCANIMNPNREELGVGYYRLDGSTYTHYWTQNFGGG